jgi:hypothetical protein
MNSIQTTNFNVVCLFVSIPSRSTLVTTLNEANMFVCIVMNFESDEVIETNMELG